MLVAMQSGAATFKDSLAVSYKTRCTLTIRSSSHSPKYLSKGAENFCLHGNLQRMFKEALFTTAKSWKQVRRPSVSEWIKKNKKQKHCGTSIQYNIIWH